MGLLFFGIGSTALAPSPHDAIAKVNGVKITQFQFDRLYNQALRSRASDPSAEARQTLTRDIFQELVRQAAFYKEAKSYGLSVSDHELQATLAQMPAFQKDGQFDPRLYYQTLYQVFGMKPDQFEDMRRKDLMGLKLNQLIASAVHVSSEHLEAAKKQRLAIETDPETIKKIKDDPTYLRNEIRNQEVNLVFGDWLSRLNSRLRVTFVSKDFQNRLENRT